MKLTFEQAMEKINDDFCVKASDVQSRALRRKIWIAEWHIHGCLSESQCYCLTKADAIESACMMAEGENGFPRGMKTSLRKYGRFASHSEIFGNVINEIYQLPLSDLI